MQAVHRTLLEVNEEFLVSEAPTIPLLHALLHKDVLTDLDLQQLSSLEPQGSRALKRFVLHVLPLRGPLAYPAFLEALQEAQAQHLVDLLLEGEAVLNAAVKPIDLPEPTPPSQTPPPDPNEYARKLSANRALIEQAVQPQDVTPSLQQAGVISPLEDALLDKVKGQHALTWSVLWGVLLQRGLRAYSVFMGALLQNGYPALFHTIEETKVNGADAMMTALNRNMAGSDVTNPDSTHNPHNTHLPPQPPYRASHTPRLQISSQLFTNRTTHHEMQNVFHPHADPLSPGYSLGDMEFSMYTPRTRRQQGLGGAPSGPSLSGSVDMLYDPSWADPYNHLRGSDLVTPRSVLDRTPEAQNTTSTLLLNQGNESADPNQAQLNGHRKTSSAVANQTGLDDHERTSPTQVADSQKDAEPPPNPEEAASEQEAGSDDQRGPVSEESTEKPTSANAPDDTQVSAKPLDDPEIRKTPTLSEEPKAQNSTEDDSKSNPPDDQNLKKT